MFGRKAFAQERSKRGRRRNFCRLHRGDELLRERTESEGGKANGIPGALESVYIV